jgi:hypothetical protein
MGFNSMDNQSRAIKGDSTGFLSYSIVHEVEGIDFFLEFSSSCETNPVHIGMLYTNRECHENETVYTWNIQTKNAFI